MKRKLIELGEARRIVSESCGPLAAERVPLPAALARVLASDVRSDSAVPGFDNSAMDGFALRAEDTSTAAPGDPVRLRIAGESSAGHPAERTVGAGEAIRISTGAVLPDGADAIVPLEEVSERDGVIETGQRMDPGRYVRRAGEDIEPGEIVLSAGTPLGAAELGVLASLGRDPVPCRRRPRLSLITTGDELVDATAPLRRGEVRDASGVALPALAAQAGAEVVSVERVRDDPDATREVLAGALEADVTVICGGVSVGEHDHVRPVLRELGVEQRFWGVALRPGRPTWFGLRGGEPGMPDDGGTTVFGLPGNPVSALVTFLLFVRPAVRALTGLDPEGDRVTAVLDHDLEKPPGRSHAVRVALHLDEEGWRASATRPEQASHILTSMLGADGLAIVPAEVGRVPAGTRVDVELI